MLVNKALMRGDRKDSLDLISVPSGIASERDEELALRER